MSKEYDLIVVGGGPAGSTLAALVAKQGHRVLLLERARFPRYQIGESLLPATIHGIARLLGVRDQILGAGFVRKGGGTWRWGKEAEPWVFDFADRPNLVEQDSAYAFQVERSKFDHILLENAKKSGAVVLEEHAVKGLLSRKGRIAGVRSEDASAKEHEWHGRFVADTSGHQSSLYTHVGRRRYSRFFQNIALFTYYEGAKRLPPPRQGNILCEAFNEGWFWYIPLSDSLTSVGAVIAKEHAALLKQSPEDAMSRFVAGAPHVRELLRGAHRVTGGDYGRFRIRRDYSYTTTHFWAPGMLLAGDAACFVDPVLSTGVHLATYGALLAARSINTCLAAPRLSKGQEAHIMDEFEHRYRAELRVIYEFLISFYDRYRDHDSYFWQARKVLGTEERQNHAFIRLVAGGATTGDEFFNDREALSDLALPRFRGEPVSDLIERRIAEHKLSPKALREGTELRAIFGREEVRLLNPDHAVRERPVREGGLIASADRMRWQEPS